MVALAVALVVLGTLRVDRRTVPGEPTEAGAELQPSGRWPNGSYL
jgi:hypothetical protein